MCFSLYFEKAPVHGYMSTVRQFAQEENPGPSDHESHALYYMYACRHRMWSVIDLHV